MTIDGKKLDKLCEVLRACNGWNITLSPDDAALACAALTAYAATLPREVERWAVYSASGTFLGTHQHKETAERSAAGSGDQVVRLTGAAVLPRVKD